MSVSPPSGPTAQLARFAAGMRWEGLPPEVQRQGQQLFLNAVGNMLGGAGEMETVQFATLLAELEPGSWRAPGRPEGLTPGAAASLAGFCATILDFDDYHHRSEVHPGPAVAPATLIAGAMAGRTVGEVLTAFVAGSEIALRVGLAAAPEHYASGWHATATCGVFGAAAAAAVATNLEVLGIQSAMGLALGRAAGTRAAFGTDLKPLHAASCAGGAFLAAQLAALRLSAPAEPLIGPHGFLSVYTGTAHPARLTEGLGQHWELLDTGIKAFPCGIVNQSACAAALAIRREWPDSAGALVVEVALPPAAAALVDRPEPATPIAARMSVQHCVAVALADGACGLEQFTPLRLSDPALKAFRARVRLVADPGLSQGAGVVTVHTHGRSVRTRREEQSPGSPERPFTEEEVRDKFVRLAAPIIGTGDAEAVARLAVSPDVPVRDLLRCLR